MYTKVHNWIIFSGFTKHIYAPDLHLERARTQCQIRHRLSPLRMLEFSSVRSDNVLGNAFIKPHSHHPNPPQFITHQSTYTTQASFDTVTASQRKPAKSRKRLMAYTHHVSRYYNILIILLTRYVPITTFVTIAQEQKGSRIPFWRTVNTSNQQAEIWRHCCPMRQTIFSVTTTYWRQGGANVTLDWKQTFILRYM